MKSLMIDDWMVAWTPVREGMTVPADCPQPGSIKVGPWPDQSRWSSKYFMTTGCCEMARHKFPLESKVGQMFVDFHTIVVRDGIDLKAAHNEFLKIDEYRRRISTDLVGSDREYDESDDE